MTRARLRGVGHPHLVTRALAALSARHKLGTELAWRIDMVRSIGVTAAFEHLWPATDWADPADVFHQRIWREAADAVGAELEDLGSGFLALRRGDRSTIVWQHHVMLDDPVTLRLTTDKSLDHRLLADAGLPVTVHTELDADDRRGALRFLAESQGPCVVKPARGTGGGYGVTCGVTSADDLVRASMRARHLDRRLLIERQVAGDEYRFLFLDGELLDVVRRRPLRLVGDGRSTVSDLIAADNDHRADTQGWAGLRRIEVDLDSILALRGCGMTLRSVPALGTTVQIKSTANVNAPADNETVECLSDELVEDAARAALVLGVRLASVEVITPDPTRSLRAAGGAVLEVNGTPGLHYHYLVADPDRATPVAVPILERVLAEDDITASHR